MIYQTPRRPALIRRVCLALLLAFCAPAVAQSPATAPSTAPSRHVPLRIVVVGDSTVCEYPPSRPDRGWGMFLAEHFKPGTVEVINLAAAGRSTKTFIKEGRWAKALAEKPDIVLIQFGHNDSHAPEKPEATDAATDYRTYLRRYIDDTRAAGATPVLVTPMVRRTFNPDGTLQDALAPYADAMKTVAAEKHVGLVDLHASSKRLIQKLGPTASADLANRKGDATHFNEQGARAMAELVTTEIPAAAPALAPLLRPVVTTRAVPVP
jgi:lysophospholipase L1-like esterase